MIIINYYTSSGRKNSCSNVAKNFRVVQLHTGTNRGSQRKSWTAIVVVLWQYVLLKHGHTYTHTHTPGAHQLHMQRLCWYGPTCLWHWSSNSTNLRQSVLLSKQTLNKRSNPKTDRNKTSPQKLAQFTNVFLRRRYKSMAEH